MSAKRLAAGHGIAAELPRPEGGRLSPSIRAETPVQCAPCSEAELLLLCARTQMDGTRADRIRSIVREGVDWGGLLRIGSRHGMMSLLYWHLNAVCPESVPPGALEELRDSFRTLAVRNVQQTQELLHILDRLAARGVRAIPFKGLALAWWVYGNLSLRQVADLDLLIQPGDSVRAWEAMLSLGYRMVTPLDAAGLPRDPAAYEYRFARGEELIVELRWRLSPRHFRRSLDIGWLWERCQPVLLSARTVRRLPPEELLLILCIHGAKHAWDRLMWICDVAELVRAHPDLDWERAESEAGRIGGRRMVGLGLVLAHRLLGAAVPESVLRAAGADARVQWIAAQTCAWYSQGLAADPGVRVRTPPDGSDGPIRRGDERARRRIELGLTERLVDRARYRLYQARARIAPNAKDRRFIRLPARLTFLYYLLKPIRKASEYGLEAFTPRE
jgi:hypothetical protein